MSEFKKAAVKILMDSKVPMHYKEITERALKMNLVKTKGLTPDATLNSLLRDIQKKGDKSQFIKLENGKYSLNVHAQVSIS